MSHSQSTSGKTCLRIQSFACVLVLSDSWKIIAVSSNVGTILGMDATELMGKQLEDAFCPETVHRLRSRAQVLTEADPTIHIANCPLDEGVNGLDVTASRLGGCFVLECEPHERIENSLADTQQVQRLINRVAQHKSLGNAATEAVRVLRALLAVDRVALHPVRADHIWPEFGRAVGAPLPDAHLSDLSLSDIRHVHLVPDLNDAGVVVHWLKGHGCSPEDQADITSILACRVMDAGRSAQMIDSGLQASITVPIHQAGELWGVFLCYNSQTLTPTFRQRSMISVFANLLGLTLTPIIARETHAAQIRAGYVTDAFLKKLANQQPFVPALSELKDEIRALIACDSFAIWCDGDYHCVGDAPAFDNVEQALNDPRIQRPNIVFGVPRLSELNGTERPERLADDPGVLVVPMSAQSDDVLLLFRKRETDQNQPIFWTPPDLAAAEVLHIAFVQFRMLLGDFGSMGNAPTPTG